MPLVGTGDALGAALLAAVDAAVAGASADSPPDRTSIYKAMGNAIIAHILAHGTGAVITAGAQPGAAALPGNLL